MHLIYFQINVHCTYTLTSRKLKADINRASELLVTDSARINMFALTGLLNFSRLRFIQVSVDHVAFYAIVCNIFFLPVATAVLLVVACRTSSVVALHITGCNILH